MLDPVLAYYLHDLSPDLLRITDTFSIRWYGLAYVLGFFIGYLLLKFLANRGYTEITPAQLPDFVTYACLFGVLLGGRLGYMLFYNLDEFLANPLVFFNIRSGGMSAHGGVLGLIVYTFVYARLKKVSWTGIGDNVVAVAPVGIFFGRCANFINGELYGRPAKVSWAVQFPAELTDPALPQRAEAVARCREIAADHGQPIADSVDAVVAASRGNSAIQDALREFLTPRHPSQLYEAFLEGLVLFAILWVVRVRWKNLPHGVLTGLFFLFYAGFRIAAENFREPDLGAEPILGLTHGQFYSVFMIVIGLAFLVTALLRGRAQRARTSRP